MSVHSFPGAFVDAARFELAQYALRAFMKRAEPRADAYVEMRKGDVVVFVRNLPGQSELRDVFDRISAEMIEATGFVSERSLQVKVPAHVFFSYFTPAELSYG